MEGVWFGVSGFHSCCVDGDWGFKALMGFISFGYALWAEQQYSRLQETSPASRAWKASRRDDTLSPNPILPQNLKPHKTPTPNTPKSVNPPTLKMYDVGSSFLGTSSAQVIVTAQGVNVTHSRISFREFCEFRARELRSGALPVTV